MKKYIGLLSEVSDVTYQNQIDVDAYVAIANKYKGRILELGSGSGIISIGLAKEGYQVTSLEIRRDMIQMHQDKLDETTRERTDIVLADMCTFDLDKTFDLIIAPNNVISYITDVREFSQMLASVKKHLSQKGVFVVETVPYQLDQLLRDNDIERTQYYTIPSSGNKVEERVLPHYNPDLQIISTSKVITEYDHETIKRRVEYVSEEKIWLSESIEQMLDSVGLSLILKSGNIKTVEAIDDKSRHIVYFIKKK